MSELKTLKDIEWEYSKKGYDWNLKQEAIKWVKHEQKGWFVTIDGKTYDTKPIASWIKHFFNLGEEDLKDE